MNQEEVWDSLSEQWFHFRQMKVPEVYEFAEKYSKKGKILDIGCGNARNLLPFAKTMSCYGVDFSNEMIKQAKKFCKKNNFKAILKKADMKKLPFKKETFDLCILADSLHSVEKNRKKVLMEMKRVLKKDGITYISVWNKWQKRFFFKSKEQEVMWKRGNKTFHRYYHIYDYFELKSLIKSTGLKIIKSKTFGKKLVFVVKK